MNAPCLPRELDDGRLDELLWQWERWMAGNQAYRELWYPDGAAGCVGGGYSQTFEDMLEQVDARVVEAVNGAIESLSPVEQCSVMHFHLSAVFRYEREPLEVVYQRARGQLKVALPNRGVY